MFYVWYKMVGTRLFFLACILFIAIGNATLSQNRSINDVSIRLISESPLIYDSKVLLPTFDGSSLWVFAEQDIWEFSMKDLSWKKSFTVDVPPDYMIIAIDSVRQQFIIRSDHGGNIYRIEKGRPSLDTLYRAEHSRIMMEHTRVMRYPQGNILSFGGYGFWQARNLVVEFDVGRKKWQPLYAIPQSNKPVPRAGALGIFDQQDQQLHIYGGYTFRYFRQDLSNDMIMLSDYWVFDTATRIWEVKTIYGMRPQVDYLNKVYLDHIFAGALNAKDRLAWYPIILKDHANTVSLMAYDLESDYGALTPVEFDMSPTNELFRGSFYDEKENQLLFLKVVIESESKYRRYRVYALSLPEASAVRAQLQKSKQTFLLRQSVLPITIILVFFLLFILGIRYRHRLRDMFKIKLVGSSEVKEVEILVQANQQHTIAIYVNHEPCTEVFTQFELSLLAWMLRYFQQPDSYLSTDEVEAQFWPNSGSIDYARKQRNVAMRRINKKFELLLAESKPLFIERSNLLDKRKREYHIGIPHAVIRFEQKA
jgi:hypothetical protein